MNRVELSDQEWGAVLALLARASWAEANPLIMKIGEQLRQQAQGRPNGPSDGIHVPDEPNARQRPS